MIEVTTPCKVQALVQSCGSILENWRHRLPTIRSGLPLDYGLHDRRAPGFLAVTRSDVQGQLLPDLARPARENDRRRQQKRNSTQGWVQVLLQLPLHYSWMVRGALQTRAGVGLRSALRLEHSAPRNLASPEFREDIIRFLESVGGCHHRRDRAIPGQFDNLVHLSERAGEVPNDLSAAQREQR